MKYQVFLLLVASSSAINMSGNTLKCVKKGNDDKCVVPDSGVECDCPPAPPTVLLGFNSEDDCKRHGVGVECDDPAHPANKNWTRLATLGKKDCT